MARDQNQCNFTGRLGKNPESRSFQDGGSVCNFSIAVNDEYVKKDTGEKVSNTEWVNIVAKNKLAEICSKYLSKGAFIRVSGKLKTRKWQDNSGADRYTTEVIAHEMQMLDSKGDHNARPSSGATEENHGLSSYTPAPAQQPAETAGEAFGDDDIPF